MISVHREQIGLNRSAFDMREDPCGGSWSECRGEDYGGRDAEEILCE
ncbi:MAG: hypothetical protein P8R37_12900 [Opitutae bacterium]|nr:hypothetical protein [Opitutae bacterium]